MDTHTHTFFDKLPEHKMELKSLVDDEEDNKKKWKIISLKATDTEDMKSEDEHYNKFVKLMFKKFKEFIRHEK